MPFEALDEPTCLGGGSRPATVTKGASSVRMVSSGGLDPSSELSTRVTANPAPCLNLLPSRPRARLLRLGADHADVTVDANCVLPRMPPDRKVPRTGFCSTLPLHKNLDFTRVGEQPASPDVFPAMSYFACDNSLRGRRLCLAFVALCALGGAGPLEEPSPPDPESLLNALRPRLAPNWWLGQPNSYGGVSEVQVVIPDEWRGNPIAAAINLCPDSESPIWNSVRIIRLKMRQRLRSWSSYECRP